MTLFDDGRRHCPGMDCYRNQAAIPEAERCTSCEGLGLVRIQFSGCFGGAHKPKDWSVCWICNGSGRKRPNENQLDSNTREDNSEHNR